MEPIRALGIASAEGRGGAEMKRALRAGAGFAMLVLLLSSCIKLDMAITVSPNNTVSGTMIFAIDKQILQLTGQTADQILQGSVPSNSPNIKAEPYSDATFVGKKYTFDSVPLSQLNAGQSTDSLHITRSGETFTVTGVMDLSNPNGSGSDAASQQIVQQAMKTAQLKIAITFPGKVASSNGQVDGNTVTWEPKVGETTTFHATASAVASGGLPIVPIAIVLIVVLAVVVVIVMQKRKSGAPAPAEDTGFAGVGAAPPSPGAVVPEGGPVPPPDSPPPPPPAPVDPPTV
jgi:hypothetical protein